MQPRKFNLGIAFFNYGSNGGIASEHPDVRRWAVPTIVAAKSDPRIDQIFHEDFCDTPITKSRNKAIRWAKDSGVDVLVMIDSDMAPDLYLGHDPNVKPFFETAFNFLYERYEREHSIIVSPYCGPPAHPTHGGFENVYVFRWVNWNTGHDEWPVKMEAYSRAEAALMTGISNIDTGPTGLSMYDMRVFGEECGLPHPYFDYEYDNENEQCRECHQRIPGERTEKATTEDCFFFRNVALHYTTKYEYNPVFCAWDCWSGHWKPWCVGKPKVVNSDIVGRTLKKAVLDGVRHDTKLKQIGTMTQADLAKAFEEQQAKLGKTQAIEPQPTYRNLKVHEAPTHVAADDDLGHITIESDIKILSEIVNEYAFDWNRERRDELDRLMIVELGSWVGKSAIAISKACGGIPHEIHCIDQFRLSKEGLWSTMPMALAVDAREKAGNPDPIFSQFLENTNGYRGVIYPHRNSTHDASKNWHKPIDILFVDAGHSYEAVTQDLQDWAKHVRPGGLIIGHDYCDMPTVQQAVDDFFRGGPDLHIAGNFWWLLWQFPEVKKGELVSANGESH